MKISKEQICVATEWWCWKLRWQTYIGLSDKQIAAFKVALAGELAKAEIHDEVDTDYGPGQVLGIAAGKAGINGSVFPWKTNMRFLSGGVQVSDSRLAPFVEVIGLEVAE